MSEKVYSARDYGLKNLINNLGDPLNPQDAATMAWTLLQVLSDMTPAYAPGDVHVPVNKQMLSAMPMQIDGFLYMDGGFLIELKGA